MGGQLIEAEHQARYRLAAQTVAGRRVLDAGCGVGWGSEILLAAGAQSVVGVDVDHGALRDARRRTRAVEFVLADLAALPFGNDGFDIITCFEAIEHVTDPSAALDELARVLASGGLLIISSPDPTVYPAGNPFHVHEFTPDELKGELGRRFTHTALWRQRALIASILDLAPGPSVAETPATDSEASTRADTVTDLTGPDDAPAPYSTVIASDRPIPPIPRSVALVSSAQLSALDQAGRDLAQHAERVNAERQVYLEDHARAVAETERLRAEGAAQADRASALAGELADREAELAVLKTTVDALRTEVARMSGERDDALLLLLDAEQDLARHLTAAPVPGG